MSGRSPVELRSRKPNQISGTIKTDNKENRNPKMMPAKIMPARIKQKSVQKLSVSQQKTPDIAVQLNEIDEKIITQQNLFNDNIQFLRKKFDEKAIQFNSIITSLKTEIEKIKANQCKCNSNALQPLCRNKNANKILKLLLHGMCINIK